jgi:hypothetical protein
MRRVVDMVIVLSAIGVIGWMLYYKLNAPDLDADAVFVRGEVRRFELEVKVRAATEDGEQTGREWPMTIDPDWFDSPPQNTLLSHDRPWVEVAPPEHADLRDPVVRLAMDRTFASFWYNPYQGIIRARVPLAVNDEQALRLYNRVNATALTTLFVAPPAVAQTEPETEKSETDDKDATDIQTHTENEGEPKGVAVSGVPGG